MNVLQIVLVALLIACCSARVASNDPMIFTGDVYLNNGTFGFYRALSDTEALTFQLLEFHEIFGTVESQGYTGGCVDPLSKGNLVHFLANETVYTYNFNTSRNRKYVSNVQCIFMVGHGCTNYSSSVCNNEWLQIIKKIISNIFIE